MRAGFIIIFLLCFQLATFGQHRSVQDSLKTKSHKIKDSTHYFGEMLVKSLAIQKYQPHEKPRVAFTRSMLLPGWGQITNKDYWKLPLIWTAAAGDIYFGIIQNSQRYRQYLSFYKQSLYLSDNKVITYNATGEVTPFTGSSQYFLVNEPEGGFVKRLLVVSKSKLYLKNAELLYTLHEQDGVFVATAAADQEPEGLAGPYSPQVFENAKNQFRRYRDLSIIAFAAGWLFQALEANVAAHMKTFDMSNDISLKIKPAGSETFGMPASGLSLTLRIK